MSGLEMFIDEVRQTLQGAACSRSARCSSVHSPVGLILHDHGADPLAIAFIVVAAIAVASRLPWTSAPPRGRDGPT